MKNNDFPKNIAIKCNKQEAFKFIEWCKNNGLTYLSSDVINTPENPWHFNDVKEDYIAYYIHEWISYSRLDYAIDHYDVITFKEFAIKYKQLAIKVKDDVRYNLKIIKYLESIGGINDINLTGHSVSNSCYYINHNNTIYCDSISNKLINFTLEELMEIKEIKIEIPEGYEIDESRSTFTNIVFKPIKITYNDIAKKLFRNNTVYYLSSKGANSFTITEDKYVIDVNNSVTKKQVEKLIAINKLMNVAKYLNGNDYVPTFCRDSYYISVDRITNNLKVGLCGIHAGDIYFKTKELAEQAIEILGKNTIRLALCTDY